MTESAELLAQGVCEVFAVDYTLDGVKAVEQQINKNRKRYEQMTDQEKRNVSYKIGSYLGVCMIRNYGAVWEKHEMGLAVKLGKTHAFPLQKVMKFLGKDGVYDSISSFYEFALRFEELSKTGIGSSQSKSGPVIIDTSSELKKKPWWKFWR